MPPLWETRRCEALSRMLLHQNMMAAWRNFNKEVSISQIPYVTFGRRLSAIPMHREGQR